MPNNDLVEILVILPLTCIKMNATVFKCCAAYAFIRVLFLIACDFYCVVNETDQTVQEKKMLVMPWLVMPWLEGKLTTLISSKNVYLAICSEMIF